MKFIVQCFSFLLLTLGLLGCSKEPGSGGLASVSGVIWEQDWDNTFSVINSEFPAMDEDVYLIYGDHKTYDDDVKTTYNGAFQFKYLYPGKYSLYVYSDRAITPGNTSKVEPVVVQFEIKDKRENVVLDTIIIKK